MSIKWTERGDKYVGRGETGVTYRVWRGRIVDSVYAKCGLDIEDFKYFSEAVKFCENYDKELADRTT